MRGEGLNGGRVEEGGAHIHGMGKRGNGNTRLPGLPTHTQMLANEVFRGASALIRIRRRLVDDKPQTQQRRRGRRGGKAKRKPSRWGSVF